MTDEDKALVDRLRNDAQWVEIEFDRVEQMTLTTAADRIEAQAAEIERLTINGIHTCHDECQRVPCMQRREIKHLKDILEIWITNYQRSNGLKHDDALAYAKAWMFRNANGEEPK